MKYKITKKFPLLINNWVESIFSCECVKNFIHYGKDSLIRASFLKPLKKIISKTKKDIFFRKIKLSILVFENIGFKVFKKDALICEYLRYR